MNYGFGYKIRFFEDSGHDSVGDGKIVKVDALPDSLTEGDSAALMRPKDGEIVVAIRGGVCEKIAVLRKAESDPELTNLQNDRSFYLVAIPPDQQADATEEESLTRDIAELVSSGFRRIDIRRGDTYFYQLDSVPTWSGSIEVEADDGERVGKTSLVQVVSLLYVKISSGKARLVNDGRVIEKVEKKVHELSLDTPNPLRFQRRRH